MEYSKFAKYYDILYVNKNYENEVEFLKNFLSINDNILDVGIGTGNHAQILENAGYKIDGIDQSEDMLKIARKKIKGDLYLGNLLNLKINRNYDVIISMFAVLNHLQNTSELEKALKGFNNLLNEGGKIIIDLHNPQSSGEKIDNFDGIKRKMKWHFDKDTMQEKSIITYILDNEEYMTEHSFKIFTIDEIIYCIKKCGFEILGVYENYNINVIGNDLSKNLQFVAKKCKNVKII